MFDKLAVGNKMIIDHIGIRVNSIEEGIKQWENIFNYKQMTEVVINSRQNVKVVFLAKENSLLVKLFEPLNKNSSNLSSSQRGEGLHHICFKCSNLTTEINRLKKLGLKITAQPQPGEAFENENIAFFYGKQGLNIELIETDKKANLIDNSVSQDMKI
jgi:methylmalonyl-CoA/ethylmalonyl-CoA epimerase